jgi:hypothetical protein
MRRALFRRTRCRSGKPNASARERRPRRPSLRATILRPGQDSDRHAGCINAARRRRDVGFIDPDLMEGIQPHGWDAHIDARSLLALPGPVKAGIEPMREPAAPFGSSSAVTGMRVARDIGMLCAEESHQLGRRFLRETEQGAVMPDNPSDRARGAGKPDKPHGDGSARSGSGLPGPRSSRPAGPHRRRRKKPTRGGGSGRRGSIRLTPIGANRFELVHPACVRETQLDYEEGLEIWKAGDPEGARDALRYALGACGDNLWIHVALGRIALEEFRDPGLARGHFGYAVAQAERAIGPPFAGILPLDRPNNRPFYDAVEGLIRALDALGLHAQAAEVRAMKDRLSGGSAPGRGKPLERPDSSP